MSRKKQEKKEFVPKVTVRCLGPDDPIFNRGAILSFPGRYHCSVGPSTSSGQAKRPPEAVIRQELEKQAGKETR